MIFKHEQRHGTWIDLERPTEDEIRRIAQEYNIGARVEAELLAPTPVPLVAEDGSTAFSVLHFPSASKEGTVEQQEVDFIVGPGVLITVRYAVVVPLHALRKVLETEEILNGASPLSPDVLLEIMFAHLYGAARDHTTILSEQLSAIERTMFGSQDRSSVRAISDVSRAYLHLESGLLGQEEPLERFVRTLARPALFGHSFVERGERIRAELKQTMHLVAAHRAMAVELRETNKALIEFRQNEVMKTLTVANFIFLPLGLVAWIFAMRTEGLPFVNSPHAFWFVLGFMGIVAFLLLLFFIKKRWIF